MSFPPPPAILHWLRTTLDIHVPDEPLTEGHATPADYLTHAFSEDPATPRDCLVWANRGGGKTFYAAVATMLDLVFKPGIEVRLLGGSLEQSARMHEHLRRLFEHPSLADLVDGRMTDRRLRLRNGSRAEILAPTHTSVRGSRPQKLRCDEVELFDPEIWTAAQLTTRSKRCGDLLVRASVEALSTWHRPGGLMKTLTDECAEGARTLFRWGLVDVLERCPGERPCEPCPLLPDCGSRAKRAVGHISIDDAVTMRSRVDAATWDAEMLCRRPSRSDAVYPEFDHDTHVRPFDPPASTDHAQWLAGMDFGYRNPTAILFAFVGADDVLHIIDERIERERILDDHIAALHASPWPRPAWIGVDPAGLQVSDQTGLSPVQALRRAGFSVRHRSIPLALGLRAVRARLAAADASTTLLIHPRCERLIESLESYRYPADRPDCLTPVKDGHDHAPDALRYLITNHDHPHTTRFTHYG